VARAAYHLAERPVITMRDVPHDARNPPAESGGNTFVTVNPKGLEGPRDG
jgi:hypothetical protein